MQTKFIELTQLDTDKKILINASNIVTINLIKHGELELIIEEDEIDDETPITYIETVNDTVIYVQESYDEIVELLNERRLL